MPEERSEHCDESVSADSYSIMFVVKDNVEMRRQRGLIEIEMENKRLRVANKELRRRRQYFRTLEHMHERLHSEQSMFDTTMKAYEMALAVRRLEKQDMRLLSAEVRQVKEVEEQELLNIKVLSGGCVIMEH